MLELSGSKVTSRFLGATNFLRGIAALSVLLWHYQHFFFANPSTFDRSQQPFYSLFNTFYINGFLVLTEFTTTTI
jgi:peptidoglycan/LPS O-acetylase OafA/YrhL